VTLCHRVSLSWSFERAWCPHLQGSRNLASVSAFDWFCQGLIAWTWQGTPSRFCSGTFFRVYSILQISVFCSCRIQQMHNIEDVQLYTCVYYTMFRSLLWPSSTRMLEDFCHAFYLITSVFIVSLQYDTLKMAARVTETCQRNCIVEHLRNCAFVGFYKKISSS
jgi:hypothetical protein